MNESKRIMIADDDQGILDVVQIILEDEGYTVEANSDGEFVKNMKIHLPDLLLLDIWMSGVDGQDICRHLKSQPETKHIPIIMISANKDTAEKAKACGADDFISKPFDIDDLIGKVKQYIG